MNSPIDHPSHYSNPHYKKECIDAMQEVFGNERTASFCLLNAFKYLWRRDHKENRMQDTAKAQWYLDKYNTITGKHVSADNLLTVIDLYRVNDKEATTALRIAKCEQREKDDQIRYCLHRHLVIACTYCPEKETCPLRN